MSRDHRFQNVLDLLRRQIDSSFAPGERLPSKRELASMHGVGARTVERALKVLAAEGCVKVMPRVGSVRAGANRRSTRRKR
jgi:DNA-binding GntR family transcriptional regulator